MQKQVKLFLKGVEDSGEPFTKEIHSLDEVKDSGNYTVVGRNLSTANGMPNVVGKTENCFCCEALLSVTCCYPEDESQSNTAYGQSLTICDRETGCTNTYSRTISPTANNGRWSEWQMVATGDIDLIEQNNEISQAFTNLSHKIEAGLTVRFARVEENEAVIKTEAIDAVAEVVYYKPSNIFVAADSNGNYYDNWDGIGAYMRNGEVRDDKVFLCGGALYKWNGYSLALAQYIGTPNVELGGISDTTFLPSAKTNRARCQGLLRKDILCDFISQPPSWRIWIQAFDEHMRWIENIPLLWYSTTNALAVRDLGDNYVFFNMVFKREDEGDITEDDLKELNSFIDSITRKAITYELQDFNNTRNNITISYNRIIISGNGFSLVSSESAKYYVGYVQGEDVSEQIILDGGSGITRRYAYVDTEALIPGKRVAFSKAIVVSDNTPRNGRYLLLATWENSILVANGLIAPVYTRQCIETLSVLPIVELGMITDNTLTPGTNTKRARCLGIRRKDIARVVLPKPNGLRLWLQLIRVDGSLYGTDGSLWGGGTVPINVYTAFNKEVEFINFVFKRDDEGDITEDDLRIARAYIFDILSNFSRAKDYMVKYNVSEGNISVSGSKLIIQPDGFGLELPEGKLWIADKSKARIEPYVFEVPSNIGNGYVVVDTTKLSTYDVRTELSDVVAVRSFPLQSDIPIAYYYAATKKMILVGQFAILYEEKPNYNNDVLFSPEFYAYKHGRRNKSNGVGTGWYERFRIIHLSDTHQFNALYREALSVANTKANVVVNTGDDSNGVSSSDGTLVNTELSTSISVVNSFNTLPFMQVAGNHDVTGITKQDYFDKVCQTIQSFSANVVWGDADNYRSYGYIDFTQTSYEGTFRIIMLDPFDYDDGLFETTYPFMSAVFSQKQIDWLIDTLLDAATKELNVLTMMHYSFGDADFSNETFANPDATYCQDAFMIPDIVDAIQKKTTLNVDYPDVKGVNNITITRDFADAGDLKFVAHLFGHIHSKNHFQCKKSDGSKEYDMLMLGETALGTYGNALNRAYKEANTINNIAFSALEIDVVEKAVYRVSYGAFLNYDKSNSERTTKIPYRFGK